MKYIESLSDGMRVSEVYLCKSCANAVTRNNKEYMNLVLQDRTGRIDAKIWEPSSPGIGDFSPMDFVRVEARVSVWGGANQLSITRIQRAPGGSFDPRDYFPVSKKDIAVMRSELLSLADSVRDEALHSLLIYFFGDDSFMREFCSHSAAKAVHHGCIGGLLEHSLSVAQICDFLSGHYGNIVNRDLLVSAALLHDIGKLKELSAFPDNDYTDEGQLLGHIVMGTVMLEKAIASIPDFPEKRKNELLHIILSHHGEFEYGSPKKPALIEAVILSKADDLDAKTELMYEALSSSLRQDKDEWLGFNKFLDSNLRRTSGSDF